MSQLARNQNDSNGLSPLTLEGQLRAAQQAARQAQAMTKTQKQKIARFMNQGVQASDGYDEEGNSGKRGASPLIPINDVLQSGNKSEEEDESADNEMTDNSGERATNQHQDRSSDVNERQDYVELALERAKARKQQAVIEEQQAQADGEEAQNDSTADGAQKAFGLAKWLVDSKHVQIMVEAIPETFGVSILALDAVWVWDNTLMAAKKKWPIEATILLLVATLFYLMLIFLVMAFIAMIISFMNMSVGGKIVAVWDWGFSSLTALTKLFQ